MRFLSQMIFFLIFNIANASRHSDQECQTMIAHQKEEAIDGFSKSTHLISALSLMFERSGDSSLLSKDNAAVDAFAGLHVKAQYSEQEFKREYQLVLAHIRRSQQEVGKPNDINYLLEFPRHGNEADVRTSKVRLQMSQQILKDTEEFVSKLTELNQEQTELYVTLKDFFSKHVCKGFKDFHYETLQSAMNPEALEIDRLQASLYEIDHLAEILEKVKSTGEKVHEFAIGDWLEFFMRNFDNKKSVRAANTDFQAWEKVVKAALEHLEHVQGGSVRSVNKPTEQTVLKSIQAVAEIKVPGYNFVGEEYLRIVKEALKGK